MVYHLALLSPSSGVAKSYSDVPCNYLWLRLHLHYDHSNCHVHFRPFSKVHLWAAMFPRILLHCAPVASAPSTSQGARSAVVSQTIPGPPPPPPLHVEDLQLRTNAASPATAQSLFQHCRALVLCRWHNTLDTLQDRLHSIVRLQAGLSLPTSLSHCHVQAVCNDFSRQCSHAVLHPVAHSSLRLSPVEAARLCHVRHPCPASFHAPW